MRAARSPWCAPNSKRPRANACSKSSLSTSPASASDTRPPMKIDDPTLFSVVIPTFEGTPFLERTLDYFRDLAFKGRIVLADNSSGEHRKFVAACAGKYPALKLEVLAYPETIRFLDKLTATLEKIDSQFVLLHAHDDFMVPQG